MKQTTIGSKETNELLAVFQIQLSKKDHAERVEEEDLKYIYINKEPAFFYYQERIIPTLRYLQTHCLLKKVTIDMGAIKFIINGADIMRPGIKEIEAGFQKEDLITIVDANNKKPLAVGIALVSSPEMQAMTTGKVIKNIHYVGDRIWKRE